MRQHTKSEMEQHKTEMTTAALKLAEKIGFENLTRDNIAEACGVSPALINFRFGTMTDMRRSILRAAVKSESLKIVAYAIATHHPVSKKISPELRKRALDKLATH